MDLFRDAELDNACKILFRSFFFTIQPQFMPDALSGEVGYAVQMFTELPKCVRFQIKIQSLFKTDRAENAGRIVDE